MSTEARSSNPASSSAPSSTSNRASGRNRNGDEMDELYENIKENDVHIAELQRHTMKELLELARQEKLTDYTGLKKQDLIFKILKERTKMNGLMFGEGTLEILPDGFGFLRSPDYHYLPAPTISTFRPARSAGSDCNGATVAGQIRPPKENERYFALLRVEAINGQDPNLLSEKVFFDDLTPLHPEKRLRLAANPDDLSSRVVDIVAPIGMGQRGLIVSPACRENHSAAESREVRHPESSRCLRHHAVD
ncbi:MAG: Rho termination factor N-terminal domain-containing protein [Planctomycetaceae bacterium]